MFHYTFVVTLYYVLAFTDVSAKSSFLGFSLSRIEWVYVGLLGTAILNSYIARQFTYLTTLVEMYPPQRRKLRFLTWHHFWLFNPFRLRRLRYSRRALRNKEFTLFRIRRFKVRAVSAYYAISLAPLFYIFNLFLSWWGEQRNFIFSSEVALNSIILVVLFLATARAEITLDWASSRHQWKLWGYNYPYSK